MHPKQQHIVDIYGKYPETLDEVAESVIAGLNETNKTVGFAWRVGFDPKARFTCEARHGGCTTKKLPNGEYPSTLPGMYGRVWYRYKERDQGHGMARGFADTLTYTGSGGSGAYDGLWHNLCSAVYRTRERVADSSRCHGFRNDYKYPEPQCYSLDYRFFLEDFPAVAELIIGQWEAHNLAEDQAETWARIQGKWYTRNKFKYFHNFEWEDPTVKAADAAFLKEYEANLKEGDEPFSKKIGIHMPA